MLQSRAHYVASRFDQTKNNGIESIGGVAGENHAIWTVAPEKVADLVSDLVHVVLALSRQVIATAAR